MCKKCELLLNYIKFLEETEKTRRKFTASNISTVKDKLDEGIII